jgi:hypothetical protein
MAEFNFAAYLNRYGRPGRRYPAITLDSTGTPRPTVIVTIAGGAKAVVHITGLATGESGEHLGIDVHAFVDEPLARTSAVGIQNGDRHPGSDETAPGRPHSGPANRGVTVLIGAQSDTPTAQA